MQLLLGAGKVPAGNFWPGQQAAGEGVFDIRQLILARRVQHEIDDLLIAEALKRAEGNQSIASRLIGISQPALSKRLKKSGDPG